MPEAAEPGSGAEPAVGSRDGTAAAETTGRASTPRGTRVAGRAGPQGGRLYVVSTPIGNLEDVTLRALAVLAAVPLIAAEDTRLTRRLLVRHDIRGRLTSHHARSSPARTAALLEHLRGGRDLALVTDAGTPAVSDPGEALVAAWVGEGGTVIPVPGPSAVIAAVAASGIAGPRWAFEGFLPRSGRDRRRRIARIAADERGTVLFEAPGRVVGTLLELAEACGPERRAAVCRELTKVHESIERGVLGELAALAADGRIPARGEFVLVVGSRTDGGSGGRRDSEDRGTDPGDAQGGGPGGEDPRARLTRARAEVQALIRAGVARGEAARRVAAATGLPRRSLYQAPGRG